MAPTVVVVGPASGAPLGPPAGVEAQAPLSSWVPRERVDVEWHGSWWPATLMERRGQHWLVHYEGWGDDWDELVTEGRIREHHEDDKVDEEPSDAPDTP